MTILLVEDDALIALDVAQALEAANLKVQAFPSAEEAGQWLQLDRPRAAIVDFKLKDGNCRALTTQLSASGIPFVLYTGMSPGEGGFGPDLADAPILLKPSPMEDVVAAVNDLML